MITIITDYDNKIDIDKVIHVDRDYMELVRRENEDSVLQFCLIAFTSAQFWFMFGTVGAITFVGILL